jgi:hypothetical protein
MEGKRLKTEMIDLKLLEGLTFRGATEKIVEKNGRKMRQGIPFEIPLKKENVLSCTDYGDHVVIAGNDGRKHTVKKALSQHDSGQASVSRFKGKESKNSD